MQMKRKKIDVNVLRPALGMKKLLKIMVEVEAHVTKRYWWQLSLLYECSFIPLEVELGLHFERIPSAFIKSGLRTPSRSGVPNIGISLTSQ